MYIQLCRILDNGKLTARWGRKVTIPGVRVGRSDYRKYLLPFLFVTVPCSDMQLHLPAVCVVCAGRREVFQLLRGVYTSTSAMLAGQNRQKTISENLSNVNTPGYRAGKTAVSPFGYQLLNRVNGADTPAGGLNPMGGPIGSISSGARVSETTLKQDDGNFYETGRDLDVAISGPGYLILETEGGPRLTRQGSLQTDAEGFLTAQGHRLMSTEGDLQVHNDDNISITDEGELLVDGELRGRLAIAVPPAESQLRRDERGFLQLEGDAFEEAFVNPDGLDENGVSLQSGYLENSNVDVVTEMTQLLSGMRNYGANHTAFTVQNSTIDEVLNLLRLH